jgi:hypothetical protein
MVGLQLGIISISEADNLCQEVYVCVRCKYRELGNVRAGVIHEELIFALIIEWKSGIPTLAEIRAIRIIDVDLKYRSLQQVMTTLKENPTWEIKVYSKSKLDELCQLCQELQLRYRVGFA